ncbi:hypothetical protein KW850_31475 [Bacillus sp. sid0103]|uniref:hypothetical protein n=1 Tax=Bacillus sp. sid0103 TaxID=2856337 RepID=UPI001C45184C|nr:hypothetical protein [Bacillus sp. sid0103]MBV7509643.1 hypothetical protein [Bacillus sp. sid0103]
MKDLVEIINMAIQILSIISIPLSLLIWIVLGFKPSNERQKEKSTTKKQLVICFLFVFVALPLAYFIGGVATDSANDWETARPLFWRGFSFITVFPLFC